MTTTTKKITLVELTIYSNVYPLVSGYMQAYACRDEELRNAFAFEKRSAQMLTDRSRLLSELIASEADIYGFSCYVWNIGLVRFLLRGLLEARPGARFILGGPQVMNQGAKYLTPAHEGVAICNGESELTFANYLRQLLQERPDLSAVRGLSFYRDGTLVTTPEEERLRDLDQIPSPFLGGLFEKGKYTYAVYETNRGCPYHCGFCFWGGGPGDRLSKFGDARVHEELAWLAKNNVIGMNLADANWGILPRDVEFSKHIAALRKRYLSPYMIVTNTAKNKPERMAEISQIFKDAGIMSPHTISVQSMNAEVLAQSDRKNMPVKKYKELQAQLYERNIGNYIELIWPLPGETIASFKAGINELCESRTECVFVYSHVLLHNTSFYDRREAFGFVTERAPLDLSEVDIITATRDVSRADFEDGLWHNFALTCLYNARGLYATATHLHEIGKATFAQTFDAFAAFCRANPDAHPAIRLQASAMGDLSYYNFAHSGMLLHLLLHERRAEFDALLVAFASAESWWSDETVRAVFEADLLNKPIVYSNTPIAVPSYPFEQLKVTSALPTGIGVGVPPQLRGLLAHLITGFQLGDADVGSISYKRKQLPYMKGKSLEENAGYVNGVMLNMSDIVPLWTPGASAAKRAPTKLPVVGA